MRLEAKNTNLTEKGAYVLAEADGKRQAILIATGSEVSLALEAKKRLEADGIGTRVVSMPCMELFAQQDEAYRRKVLPAGAAVRVGIEAAVRQGWDQWLLGNAPAGNPRSSAWTVSVPPPLRAIVREFGITADNVVPRSRHSRLIP